MELSDAVVTLSALSQETRLQVFRLLMKAGPEGLPASRIADRLGVQKSLMSAHLATLTRAGLLTVRRESRWMIYAVDFPRTRALLSFLVQDCCNGQPDICAGLLDQILPCDGGTPDQPTVQ
ncbi:MAG: ArsR/SmtB family transcription factor [Alphaproteobacteria bacterium]